jgi:hypothetical protein
MGLEGRCGRAGERAGEWDDDHHRGNPIERILHKLDKILDAIKGGGGQDGNHTLRWDANHPSSSRFVVLKAFHNQAVLDKNTGLVWEQAPASDFIGTFSEATDYCVNKTVGGTRGWRLPSVAELASLIDPSLSAPLVPTNVFSGLQGTSSTGYWSATTVADNPDKAWRVLFSTDAVPGSGHKSGNNHFPGVFLSHTWCVRGDMNADVY